jgi:predicted nucleic acid-binding protein
MDTGAFYAAIDRTDTYHKEAVQLGRTLESSRLITSEYILMETATFIRSRLGPKQSINFLEHIKNKNEIEVIEMEKETNRKAWDLFYKYHDKVISFVDCTSNVLMKERDIYYYFGFDSDLSMMGFNRII